MTATVTNLHEWAERRAHSRARDHLRQEGWLPSGIEALISLMELPAGELGETIAENVRSDLVGLFTQVQADMGVAPMEGCILDPEELAVVWQRLDELCAERIIARTGVRR